MGISLPPPPAPIGHFSWNHYAFIYLTFVGQILFTIYDQSTLSFLVLQCIFCMVTITYVGYNVDNKYMHACLIDTQDVPHQDTISCHQWVVYSTRNDINSTRIYACDIHSSVRWPHLTDEACSRTTQPYNALYFNISHFSNMIRHLRKWHIITHLFWWLHC